MILFDYAIKKSEARSLFREIKTIDYQFHQDILTENIRQTGIMSGHETRSFSYKIQKISAEIMSIYSEACHTTCDGSEIKDFMKISEIQSSGLYKSEVCRAVRNDFQHKSGVRHGKTDDVFNKIRLLVDNKANIKSLDRPNVDFAGIMHNLLMWRTFEDFEKDFTYACYVMNHCGINFHPFRVKDVGYNISEGGTPNTSNDNYWENGTIPWISAPDIKFPDISVNKKITESGLLNSSAKLRKKGDILFSSKGTVGKVGVVRESLVTNQNVMAITPDRNVVDSEFLAISLFNSAQTLDSVSKSTTMNAVYGDDIKFHKIYLPSLAAQKYLSRALKIELQRIAITISILREKLVHLDEYKTALIHSAVTKGLDANGCRILDGTPASEMEWSTVKLKDLISENEKSKRPASEGEKSGKYQFFKSSINQDTFCDFYDYDKISVVMGDGGVANVSLSEQFFSKSDHCWSFYSKCSDMQTTFLYNFILANLTGIDDLGFKGMGIRNLDKKFVRNLTVSLPSEDYVLAINDYIEKNVFLISQAKQAITKKIDLLLEYKKSLINEAVSGEMEVN